MKNLYCFLTSLIFSLILITDSLYASIPDGIDLSKTSSGYRIDFTLPSYQLELITAEGEEYVQLLIPEYGVTPKVGLPALPLISFNLFIAYNETEPAFEINNIITEEKILTEKIFPFQMPWEKSNPLDERPFTINTDYYNSTGNMEQPLVQISDPFIIAGVKGVIVTIYPFRYNPKEDKLVIVNSGSIDILLDYPVLPVTNKSEMFNQFFRNVFANYEGVSSKSNMKYLIITAPTFESGMQQFVSHKTSKDFDVDMFNTNTTGTTNTAIKNFIQQRYNDPNTKPEFILLVGDVAQIPSWIGSGEGTPNTDLNYVQLEGGDYFADAFIGRFSIATTDELQNAINKSVYMENYIGTLLKKNIFMASTDNWQVSEGTHNYIINLYFDSAGYNNLKLYTYTYGATTQQLINALNDNQQFAIYSGHGGEYSWADGPPLSQQHVRDLTNTWYPFVYSFACVTGSYHVSECFGETWLRTEHGASTFYGSSVNSYWDEDDILEKSVFKAMFEDDLTRVTPMFDQGKIYLVNHYGGITGTTLRYLEMYNLMGDPSMPVIEILPPCPVEVASNPNPPAGASNVSVNLSELSWTNGAGAVTNETYFGTNPASLTMVQSGTLADSWTIDPSLLPLDYYTTYYWKIVEIGDTCSSGTAFSFKTEQDPNLITETDTLYPQSVNYWTGTCNSTTKTDISQVITVNPELGWMTFDISSIPADATILSLSFNGYVNATNWPYWSATPMGTVNPVTDNAAAIYNQVSNNADQGVAYIYSDESSSFTTGWHTYPMESDAVPDLQNVLGQGWYAVGLIDRDASSTYYINFDGWNEPNPPYLIVNYQYITPVELTSFNASAKDGSVILNWTTATETNNRGFEIERKLINGEYQKVGYVPGFGTTTEPKIYFYSDNDLNAGIYLYRLKQIDFDGSFSYSNEVNADVTSPIMYALEQNYPNPFNPNTTIKYSIPEDSFVKLSVYNLLGEEVTTLVNNVQKAGRYEVAFDASNFASGVYLYRLEAQNYSSIKKMLLIK
jgi:hypothetical protein